MLDRLTIIFKVPRVDEARLQDLRQAKRSWSPASES